MVQPPDNVETFEALRQVVTILRGPDGCPWDKEQDHRTLTTYAIEEAHELVEAIESGKSEDVIEELGDCLLQVVLHAEIARQAGTFTLEDVIASINRKMIRRHPHVFASAVVKNSEEVLANWAVIKDQEKPKPKDSFNLPADLPALQKAQKIGHKTAAYGFDWQTTAPVVAKIDEELAELKHALQEGPTEQKEHELGDLLFSVAQLARHLGFEAEQVLRKTNRHFEQRFFAMLELATQQGHIPPAAPNPAQLFAGLNGALKEELWEQVKAMES